jgi:CheY-like chemotaxis protein
MAAILIVEDDKDTCEALVRFLQRSGHTAYCARNGREAIMLLTEKDPKLILLDASMPEMDGVTFLQVIRSYLRWRTLPAILISGVADEETLKRAAELGVRRVFRKAGFELKELLSAIDEELSGSA